MPDLLASIPLSIPGVILPPRPTPGASPEGCVFALGMNIVPDVSTPTVARKIGQKAAGDGKDLPDLAGEGDPTQTDAARDDALILWLPQTMPPQSAPVARPLVGGAATPPPGVPVAQAAVPPPQPVSDAVSVPAPNGSPAQAPGEAPAPVAKSAATPSPVSDADDAEPHLAKASVAAPRARPVPVAPIQPLPSQPVQVSVPAAHAFAAAIAASLAPSRAPASQAAPRTADPLMLEARATGLAPEADRASVQTVSATDQAPLDLSREGWIGRMIDRIAALRDSAETTDTRIRLAPEHLGNVEISIRREGDRIHVHFAAENAATRQMIADAAPRLSELAQERGVKLGQTSVDSGTGGDRGQQDDSQSFQPSARPASAARAQKRAQDARIA